MTNHQQAALNAVKHAQFNGGLYIAAGGGCRTVNSGGTRRTLRALVSKGMVVECPFSFITYQSKGCTGNHYYPTIPA